MIPLDALVSEAERVVNTQPFRYRFSKSGAPCVRALVYDAQDADDGKHSEGFRHLSHLLAAACGNAVGQHMEEAGVRLGGVRQAPAEFDTGAVKVTGRLDLVDADCVDDFKLVGEKKWSRVATRPDPAHVLQVNGYAVALDRPRWRLIYVRGTTIFDGSERPEFREYTGTASVELAQELCAVWEVVAHHRALRTLPERVFDAAPDKYPCAWCDHKERCLPEEAIE